MANPNIVNVSDIRGKTHFQQMTPINTYVSAVTNAASSGQVYKINVISISNATGSTANISVAVYRTSPNVNYWDMAKNVSVPNDSTLVVTSKDTSFYLEEGDILTHSTTVAGLEIMISYEIIS